MLKNFIENLTQEKEIENNKFSQFDIINPYLTENEFSSLLNSEEKKETRTKLKTKINQINQKFTEENDIIRFTQKEKDMNQDKDKENNKIILSHLRKSLNSSTIFINSIIIISFIFSVYFYILSLEGCSDTQTACLVNLSPEFFNNIGLYLFTSAILNSFIYLLLTKTKITKLHLIYILPILGYLMLILDTGSDLKNHGGYNRIVFLIVLLLVVFLMYFVNFILKLIQQKKFKLILFSLIFIITFTCFISYKISDCSNWNKGLNNKYIINNKNNPNDKCFISTPEKCWIDFLDGLMDVSWYLQEDCQNFRTGEKIELLKYLPERYKNTNIFGYPITTNYTYITESYHMPFFWSIMSNFIDIKNPENNNKTSRHSNFLPEIILNFDEKTQLGKIDIDIKKNKKLVEERKLISEKYNNNNDNEINNDINKKDLIDNVLFLYIDSISRPHFIRKMKNTIKFMEKHFNRKWEKEDSYNINNKINNNIDSNNINNNNNSNNNKDNHLTTPFTFYEFMKYHTFIFFTQPNVNPMFYGESMKLNNGTNIIKYFHEHGFISAQSNNICSRELYDIEPGYIENLNWEKFDHENIALFCDPNFFNPENPFTPYMGPYSVRKRCLYGRNTYEYVIDYGEKFWETYIEEKKFLRLSFQDAHEGTGEVVRYLDEYLENFLNKLDKKGWLDKTAIFIVSDHGNNMIGFYNIFGCPDFNKEKTLASWYMLLPKELKDFEENVRYNENTMVTPYDVFDTLLSLINEEKNYPSANGESVLKNKINGNDRICKKYKLDLIDLWCRCD
jgi:ABC-type multidrug transport system permease subunit